MATPDAAGLDRLPLTGRPAADVLCWRGGRPITVGRFLAEAAALAARFPDRAHAINLCTDRYRALLGFAAALSRGQTTLLCADRAPHRLRALAARFPDAHVVADGPVDTALPVLRPDTPSTPAEAGNAPAPTIPADLVAAIAFTSGSTGEPAAHPKPWGALVAGAEAAAERFGLRAADGPPAAVVATVPPQHMYGFETTLMLPLHSAAAQVAGETFYPSDVAEALASVPGRRLLVTTPLQLRALLLAAGAAPPPTLAAVISATAPLSAALAEAVERAWSVPVMEIYGATEAGSMASRRTVSDPDWLPYRGVSLHPGGVTVPGLGPVPLADALEPAPDPLRAGRFRLLGREFDVVKLGGRRASLAELNRLLLGVDGVEDGVFLAPDDLEHNPAARLSAFVVAPNRTAEAILDALRGRMEAIFLPRPVVMAPALPRDGLGKLPRRALLELRRAAASR